MATAGKRKVGPKQAEIIGKKTDLHIVHFEFSDNLDGDFTGISLTIPRTIHVAEGAISHFSNSSHRSKPGYLGNLDRLSFSSWMILARCGSGLILLPLEREDAFWLASA